MNKPSLVRAQRNVTGEYLPRSGQISFLELTGRIGSVSTSLGSPDVIEQRVVAYRDKDGRWIVYAAGLYVGYPPLGESPQVLRLGPLSLISYRGTPTDANTPDRFLEFIYSWPTIAGEGELRRLGFGDHVTVDRAGSDEGPAGYPCWRSSLYYTPSAADAPPPQGPFFDQTTRRYAERASDAAVSWLSDEVYRQGSSPNSSLRVAIADPRARMTRLSREGDSVNIAVVGTQPEMDLDVVVQTVGYSGNQEPDIVTRVLPHERGRSATIPLERPFQRFRALLFGPDGEVYDEVRESISHPSLRGYSLFGIVPSREDADLAYALGVGESDRVECKEWMPTDPTNPKAIELLQAVCAFGNGKGGSIYIGVSGQLEVKGTDKPLRTWRPRQDRGGQNLEDLRAQYSKALRARVADGISPSIPIEVDWLEHAGGEHVCRVKVRGSGQLIHSIIATNDIYVRRGANNRKARPEELISNHVSRENWPLSGFAH
jgi:hypothetical protein